MNAFQLMKKVISFLQYRWCKKILVVFTVWCHHKSKPFQYYFCC